MDSTSNSRTREVKSSIEQEKSNRKNTNEQKKDGNEENQIKPKGLPHQQAPQPNVDFSSEALDKQLPPTDV